MKKHKLFYLLTSLTKPEANRFKKYVSYPLFNTNPKVIVLVDFLTKQLGKYSKEEYEALRAKAYQKVFQKKEVNPLSIRRLLSATQLLLNDFLIIEELKLEKKQGKELLKKSFQRRKLTDFYNALLEQKRQDLEKSPTQDFYFYQENVRLRYDFYYHAGSNKYAEKDPLSALVYLHQDLDVAYLMEKLHYACQVAVIKLFTGLSKEIIFLDKALEMASDPIFKENELMQLYLHLLELLQNITEEGYKEVKKELFHCLPKLSKDLQLHLFALLLNLSWLAVDKNRQSEVLFNLYQYGLKEGVLVVNGNIEAPHFNNIVDIGCGLGKFEEVRNFIKEYLRYLDVGEDLLENVKNLFEAFLYFGEGRYQKTLQKLNYLEFKDISYGFRAYSLMIKSIYETKKGKGFKEIDAHSETFKQYIKRKYKQGYFSNRVREENLNFIKIACQLPFASKSKYAKINTDTLMKKLEGMQNVVGRTWLIQKIEEI